MVFGILKGSTRFDLIEFLPKEAPSVKGHQIMVSQDKSVSSLWLMMPLDSFNKIYDIKEKLLMLEGINEVLWLDNWINPDTPFFMMDSIIKEAYIKTDYTLMEIQIDPQLNRDEQYLLIKHIEKWIPSDAYLGGEPLILANLKKVIDIQPKLYLLIAILAIFIVLTLFLRSLAKPLVILACMGTTIIIALGFSFLLHPLTMITRALMPAILLGITLDYALFLIHRLQELSKQAIPFNEKIILAVSQTFKPVSISALTTMTGLFALGTMTFRMGPDLGLSLLRGVIISLIVNMSLLPCLIYSTQSFWEKNIKKKNESLCNMISVPLFKKIILLLFPILLLGSLYLSYQGTKSSYYISNRFQFRSNTDFMKSSQYIEKVFGSKELAYVVYMPSTEQKEEQWHQRVKQLKTIEKVFSLSSFTSLSVPGFMLPEMAQKQFILPPYRLALVFFSNPIDNPLVWKEITEFDKITQNAFHEFYITGPVGFERDVKKTLQQDFSKVTFWSICLIALIILISFRSLWLTMILIIGFQLAIWSNIGINHIFGSSLYQLTPIFISAIQMGATIDYGILFVIRFYEECKNYNNFWTALHCTWGRTLPALFASSLILFSATLGISLISSLSTASQVSSLLGRGALISFVLVAFFLPLWLGVEFKIFKRRRQHEK